MENTEKTQQTVSGTGIVVHSEEALQEKRLSISALIEKLNADIIVGDIVDDFEETRKENVAKQRDLIQKQQDEQEAKYRKEKEEQEAKEAEEERQKREEKNKTNLLYIVKSLSKRVMNAVPKKTPDKNVEQKEESDEIKETKFPKNTSKCIKKSTCKKIKQNLVSGEPEDTLEETKIDLKKDVENSEIILKEMSREDIPNSMEADAVSEEIIKETEDTLIEEVLPKDIKTNEVKRNKNESSKKVSKTERKLLQKRDKKANTKANKGSYKITATFSDARIVDEYELEEEIQIVQKKEIQEETPEQIIETENQKRRAIMEEVSRFHEQTDFEEVAKFRSALERLSADSYFSVSVYAACIIDREFTSLSIIKNVSRLAELIADSDDNMDFYFAYIITNKGVQHYGSDEAISDVSLAMEELRSLFIQKKGRISVEQIQRIPSLQIFQTIYYDDNSRGLRR